MSIITVNIKPANNIDPIVFIFIINQNLSIYRTAPTAADINSEPAKPAK